MKASSWWSSLAERVRSYCRRWTIRVSSLGVLVLRVHLELLVEVVLILCGKWPLYLVSVLTRLLAHRRLALIKGLLLVRGRLLLL